MSTSPRRALALLLVPLVLLLSSCIRMTADYDIVSENEVTLVADFGIQNSAAAQMGSEVPDLCEQEGFDDVQGATAEPYAEEGDGGYTGCRISGTARTSDLSGDGTTIELADGVWTFAMEGTPGEEEMSAEMFSDFRVSVTFPGKVLSHNGTSTVEGTTVTWSTAADMFTADGLLATAEDGAGGVDWLWIALGALVIAGIAAAVVVATRNRRRHEPEPTFQDGSTPYPYPYPPGPGQQYAPPPPGQAYPPPTHVPPMTPTPQQPEAAQPFPAGPPAQDPWAQAAPESQPTPPRAPADQPPPRPAAGPGPDFRDNPPPTP